MTKINDTLENRLAKQSVITESGCVEWTGDKTVSGYGRISIDYKTKRVIVETFNPKVVASLNTAKYEAVPIGVYLASLNGSK